MGRTFEARGQCFIVHAFAMLPAAARENAGHADRERAIRPVGHDVDQIGSPMVYMRYAVRMAQEHSWMAGTCARP